MQDMIHSELENYLIQFQTILSLLIKRSSETAYFPLLSFHKSQLELQINLILKKAENYQENPSELLAMAKTTDLFLSEILDVEIAKLKNKNKSLYSEYLKCRSQNKSEITKMPNYSGEVNFGVTQAANLPYLSSRSFLIKNTGKIDLRFYLCENFKNLEGNFINLRPKDLILRTSGTLNANGKANKLYAVNKQEIVGSYKIWVL